MKKHIIAFILILSFLLAGCGAEKSAEPEEVKYYITERITTFSDGSSIRDTYEYDSKWNMVLGITYHDGEETSRIQYENTKYSTKMTILQDGEEFTMEFRITYDDQGNQIRTERYVDGELSIVTECTFDEQGNRLIQTDTQVRRNDTSKLEMEYDENGNLLKMTLDGAHNTVYTYDEKGRILKKEEFPAEGLGSYCEYSYSSDGLTKTCLIYQSNGFSAGKTIETYDTFGNMLKSESYLGGKLSSTTVNTYVGTDRTISSGIESEG